MKDRLVQSMAWLHTWGGLLASWPLYIILFSGSIACFDQELGYWMHPELHHHPPAELSLDHAAETLRQAYPEALQWYLLPSTGRRPFIEAYIYFPSGMKTRELPPDGLRLLPATVGGMFFLRLHYQLLAGTTGIYLVGLSGMLMLLALISGLIIHRRLFRDFFLLRLGRTPRAWLDGHNLTAVLGLPFHVLMAYTGIALMMLFYMPAGVRFAYHGGLNDYLQDVTPQPVQPTHSNTPAPARYASLDTLYLDAIHRQGTPPGYLGVAHPADGAIKVTIQAASPSTIGSDPRTLIYDGVSGQLLLHSPKPPAAYQLYLWLGGVHRAQFGGSFYRWLYFLLGISGCVMLACGLQLWTSKRPDTKRDAKPAWRWVGALNRGIIGGLPLASAALLYANRLLPAQLATRAHWETMSFTIVWGLALLATGPWTPPQRAWRALFASTALLLLALPLLNYATDPQGALPASLMQGKRQLAAIDLASFLAGLLFARLARRRQIIPLPSQTI